MLVPMKPDPPVTKNRIWLGQVCACCESLWRRLADRFCRLEWTVGHQGPTETNMSFPNQPEIQTLG